MRALILGVSGQTGSYLAEHLAGQGHEVFGMVRRFNTAPSPASLIVGDLLDQDSLERVLAHVEPDEVYNLAAVTAPGGAWGTPQPPLLADVTALGVVRLLDAMVKCAPDARLVHASTSAIHHPHHYGLYGIAKQFAHHAVHGYRGRLHCSNAVLYSHTSPRQDRRFLAPTICHLAARIAAGSTERITLTDLVSRRDWVYAGDVARALPFIAHAEPGDYVVATGTQHTVRDLTDAALGTAGLTWDEAVTLRPGPAGLAEAPADPAPLMELGWKPETGFVEMVGLMVQAASRELPRAR